MVNRPNTAAQRKQRHARVRGKISGTPERPRLCVFRSESNIYAPSGLLATPEGNVCRLSP